MWRKPSICSRICVSFIFSSVLMVLTSSPMDALCLRGVKLWGSGEAQAQVDGGEDRGDVVNRLVPIGMVHEQSPWTTHNGLRFAVEALSGGLATRIVSVSVNYIRGK